jgi:hypothetical protein
VDKLKLHRALYVDIELSMVCENDGRRGDFAKFAAEESRRHGAVAVDYIGFEGLKAAHRVV